MDKDTLKNIDTYPESEQMLILRYVCNQLYIARNISLSEENMLELLEFIDRLFKDPDNFN